MIAELAESFAALLAEESRPITVILFDDLSTGSSGRKILALTLLFVVLVAEICLLLARYARNSGLVDVADSPLVIDDVEDWRE